MNGQGYGLRVPGLVISPYAKRGFVDHQQLSTDSYLRFIEDDFLRGARLDPRTDGRPDARPFVRSRRRDWGICGHTSTSAKHLGHPCSCRSIHLPDRPPCRGRYRRPLCYRDATMSRILTVVAAQVAGSFDAAATLQKFEEEVRMLRGAFPDAGLYVFPEAVPDR